MFSEQSYFGLGRVPIGIGAILKGWGLTNQEFQDSNRSPVVDFRAMTASCPHDCFHCYTDKSHHTLTIDEIKRVITEIAQMKAKAVNFLGEGEPTIDPHFFDIIEYTSSLGIVPVVFTDGATKMRDRNFIRHTKDAGASICLKCDSIFNAEYQNWVVGDSTGKYFDERNEAIKTLIDEGFNEAINEGTTRLGFDMVISRKNIHEVPETLRFCRNNNLWIIFAFYLPAGRSGNEDFAKEFEPSVEEKREMRDTISRIDKDEFGFSHSIWNNFATTPCVERLQVYGDGRVSPCPGNEEIIGRIQDSSISELDQVILKRFPKHNPVCFNGNCLYRP